MRQRLLFLGILLAASTLCAQEQDLSKVEVKATQLAGNLYMLQGAGGNMAASVGADGVLLVDAEFAPLADKIRASLKSLGAGGKPVRFVINTHYHFDHTGGNRPFAESGTTVIAHEALRARLVSGGMSGYGGSSSHKVKPAEPAALPMITFDHNLTVHLNGEDIRAVYYPNAHTDGDSIIFFPHANAVHMGDIYVRYGFPFIDVNAGGSVQGMIGACEDVIRTASADAKVIPGHGELSNIDALREYLRMLKDTTAAVAAALKAGKTLEQMKKEHVLGAWSERYSSPDVDADAFTGSLYYSLMGHAARHGRPRR